MTPPALPTIGRRPRLFRAESAGRSLGVYLPTAAAYRIIGLLRGVILAWLMAEKSEFGLLQIAVLAVNVLNPLCSAGLNEAVVRYVPQYETRHALRPFLARAVPLVLGVGVVLSGAVYLAAAPLGRFLFATLPPGGGGAVSDAACTALTRLAAGTTLAVIGYFLLLSILKGLRMFSAVSLVELVNNVAFTLVAVVVALSGWPTADVIVGCYGATMVVVVLVFAPPLSRVVRRAPDQQETLQAEGAHSANLAVVNQMVRFSVWAALAAVMWQTLQYYPMWYLQKVRGPEATAVFGGVRLITQAVLIGAVSIATVVQTSVTKTWESQGRREADRRLVLAFKSTALVLLVGCTVLAALARVVIRLFPAGYAEGAAVIPLLLLFFLVGGHLALLAIHFSLIEKTRYLFWPWTVGVVCNVTLGVWMVRPDLGSTAALAAAAWSGVLGVSAALVTCLYLMRVANRPLDAGSCVLLAATYALALPIYLLAPIVAVGLLLAVGTNLIFASDEKHQLRDFGSAARARIRQAFSAESS